MIDVELLLLDLPGPLVAAGGDLALVTDPLQAFGNRLGQGLFVVDDENPHGRRRGFGVGR